MTIEKGGGKGRGGEGVRVQCLNFLQELQKGSETSSPKCKGILILESGKFLPVESGIREILAHGIRNPGFSNREYSSMNPEYH